MDFKMSYQNLSSSVIKNYYNLAKPGIIYGNAITTIAGFLLASKGLPVNANMALRPGYFNFELFLATLLGISLIIGSACVFNNYIDRNIDGKMERTKKRVLVIKAIPVKNVFTYGTILGIIGFLTLFIYTNLLTVFLALIGFFFYVVMYSIWKRKSIYGTIVGSISGAIPPVVGYCAVSNKFDIGAIIFFLILVLWQMPHFYAIAIFRIKDYAAAGIPVLPVKKGILITKIHMLFYIVAFTIIAMMLTFFGYEGYVYLVIVILLGLGWFMFGVQGFNIADDSKWARKMFGISLLVITMLSVVVSIGYVFKI